MDALRAAGAAHARACDPGAVGPGTPPLAVPAARLDGGRLAWLIAMAAALVSLSLLLLVRPAVFKAMDFAQLHGFYREFARRALVSGRLPLWNPYVNLGRPFLADMEAANWYPPNLIFAVLPAGPAVALVLGLHLGLLLFGTRALGRYLGMTSAAAALPALALAAGNLISSRLMVGHLHFVEGTAYLPLLLLLAARLQDGFRPRRLALLAGVLALQLLTGHPQIAWVTWFGLAAFLLGRRLPGPPPLVARRLAGDAAAFGAALLAAFALAAVQLLPFAELVRESNRAARTPLYSAVGSLPFRDALSVLLPPGPGYFVSWEYNLYCGALMLLAGTAGLLRLRDRNVRGLALSAALAGLVALGERTPAFALAYRAVPGVSSFRIHSRLAIWACFALCMAAGLFLSRARARRLAPAKAATRMAVAIALAAAVAAGVRWRVDALPVRLLLTIAAGSALLIAWKTSAAGAVTAAVAVALAADALSAGADLRRIYWEEPHLAGEAAAVERLQGAGLLREGLPPPRTSLPRTYARHNSGMKYGFSTYLGFAGLSPARVFAYVHRRLDLPLPATARTFPAEEVAARGPFPFDSMNLVLGLDPVRGKLRSRRVADPRAFLAYRTLRVAHWSDALERVRTGHDEAQVALVEDRELELSEEAAPALAALAPGAAEVVHFGHEAVQVRVASQRPAVLVLKEAWYPGWSARIDGVRAPCLPVNVWMRGVRVPAGRHDVLFTFRSRWLPAGALVSAISVLAVALCLRRPRPER